MEDFPHSSSSGPQSPFRDSFDEDRIVSANLRPSKGLWLLRSFLALLVVILLHMTIKGLYTVSHLRSPSEEMEVMIDHKHMRGIMNSKNDSIDEFVTGMGYHPQDEEVDLDKHHSGIDYKQTKHGKYNDDDAVSSVKRSEDEQFHINIDAHDSARKHFSEDENVASDKLGDCKTKKRIILDVNKCGMGNRMVSLASTIMLALLMDRVVELDWKSNHFCGASYKEMFHSKPMANLEHDFRPFIYDLQRSIPHLAQRTETVCNIYFDQTFNYTHLAFLSEKKLYDRLDRECKVVHIQANIYYAHLLLKGDFGARLRQTFHLASPFHHVSQIVFRAATPMKKRVEDFIDEKFKGEKWLSIHARGYYDDGVHSDIAFDCANKLLNAGLISFVFVATESERLMKKASEIISADKLISIDQERVADVFDGRKDSLQMRKTANMDIAVMEWLLVGEATYCHATTTVKSTFSKTSIVNGPCAYVSFGNKDSPTCALENLVIAHHKEHLMAYHHKTQITNVPSVPDPVDQERIWQTVVKTQQVVEEQCYSDEWPDQDDLYKYWGVNERGDKSQHHNRNHSHVIVHKVVQADALIAAEPEELLPSVSSVTNVEIGMKEEKSSVESDQEASSNSEDEKEDEVEVEDLSLPESVPILNSEDRPEFGLTKKIKLNNHRFEGKDEWESGGFEAAEARRCSKAGCNPGYIVGYKDDPNAKNPSVDLMRPSNFRRPKNTRKMKLNKQG